MECSSSHSELEETCTVHHFFRNKCSEVLAKLLTRELRNSRFIRNSLQENEDSLNMSLFKLLKIVSSKGKRAQLKGKCPAEETPEEASSSSTTQHLNNLKDNEDILTLIPLKVLLVEECEAKAPEVVENLGTLDSAFLLSVLTNEILGVPHKPEVKEALDTLRDIRNSIHHKDSYKDTNKSVTELLKILCIKVKFLCKYLGIDDTSLQSYMPHKQSSFSPVFKEVKEEVHKNIIEKYPCQDHKVYPTIKHIRGDSQRDETVENLLDFFTANQVRWNEESRPFLLCGARGSGKSSVLRSLAYTVIHEELSSGRFPLVVMVDEPETTVKIKEFKKYLLDHLAKLCPQVVRKYGFNEVVNVLSSYSSSNSILFLMDLNLQNTKSLNQLMPNLECGTWVISSQGVPESSSFFYLLKMESLTERQVQQLLCNFTTSEEFSLVSQVYRTCNYKGIIDTPDMVNIFAEVSLKIKGCAPFYELIQKYINKNIKPTDDNEVELIKLGKKAFHAIRLNKKTYSKTSLEKINSNVKCFFLEYDQSMTFFFKYRVVEDYLAAKYVVKKMEESCDEWLEQAPLFKRTFEIMCALWSEQENGILTNLPYIRKYLEKLFEIGCPKRRKRKKKGDESMEIDETDDDDDDVTNHTNFVRWIFLSKLSKDHQNNEPILLLLAELLACKSSWLFKCKSLTENCIENLSLVFRHINLTKALTIKLESGPNITMLTKLWNVLSSHKGVCSNTTVRIVIHHTEINWITHENLLEKLPGTLAKTTAPLYVTKYEGPLLCSGTEQFLKCSCMKKLDVLNVYVCDVASLYEVLGHQQKLKSVIVNLNLRVEEMKIPDIRIKLSSSFPLNLTITYFKGLQALLDRIESPHRLSSLRIYRVYIHENFHLNLSRFTGLEFLSIKFLHMGRLSSIYLQIPESEERMDVDAIKYETNISSLPLQQWVLHLVLYLNLPPSLERLLLRNLTFCDDSNIFTLSKYWIGLPFQRLLLLDTHLSMSKFKEILQTLGSDSEVDEIREGIEKKCRLEGCTESSKNAVKQERLGEKERMNKRQNKPKGKEVVVTSDVTLCKQCYLLTCTCDLPSINHSRDTYQDFISLVNDVYNYKILSISYNSKDITLRKDMCGDLHVQCPIAFLRDEVVQELANNSESLQSHKNLKELNQLLGALALAQAISLTHTHLSHQGAITLLHHLKEKKKQFGRIEPFRLTIFSRHYHKFPISVNEVQCSSFTRKVKNDDTLQQFNFRCDCMKRCHNFKKSIKGRMYFNDVLFDVR